MVCCSSNAITLCEECDDEERTAALHFCLTCARPLCEYVVCHAMHRTELTVSGRYLFSHFWWGVFVLNMPSSCRASYVSTFSFFNLHSHLVNVQVHVCMYVCMCVCVCVCVACICARPGRFHRQNHQKSKQTKLHPLVALSSVTPELMHPRGHPLNLGGLAGADPSDPGAVPFFEPKHC